MVKKRGNKVKAISLIVNLIISIVAFSFLVVLNSEVVSSTLTKNDLRRGVSDEYLNRMKDYEKTFNDAVQNSRYSDAQEILEFLGPDLKDEAYKRLSDHLTITRNSRATTGGTGSSPLPTATTPGVLFTEQKISFEPRTFQGIIEPVYGAEKTISGDYSLLNMEGKVIGTASKEILKQSNLNPDLFIEGHNFNDATRGTIQVGNKNLGGRLLEKNKVFLTSDNKLLTQNADGTWTEKLKEETPPSTGTGGVGLQKWLGSWYGKGFLGNIVQGAVWAGVVYGLIRMIGGIAGVDTERTDAVAKAAAAGIFAGKGLYGVTQGEWIKNTGFGRWAGTKIGQTGITKGAALGGVVGIIVFLVILELLWKKESKKIISFECQPWQAPVGGSECEKCNSELYPCTEYRCKSLGQACQLLNPGTNFEKCAWVNPKDVNSPIIEPWKDVLTFDHNYQPNNVIRPPDRGVKIIYNKASDGCVKAFTPISFGIEVNEPSQCKIDYNRTMKYEEMTYFFGGSNLFSYNHSQTLSLPSPEHIESNSLEIKSDGSYNLYVRCIDANGNANDDLFVFSFCVEKGPDVTAPVIVATSIANNMPIQFGLNETELEVYVNEPADCKYSRVDMSYDNMENTMACNQNVWEMNNQMLYRCKTTLKGLKDYKENIFYFKCKDQPWLSNSSDRNTNVESYKFILKGTQPLTIDYVKPSNETIKGSGTLAEVWLEVKTSNGYNFGDSWCSYSTTGNEKDNILFLETGANIHKQRQDLGSGSYKYYISCVDLGGNSNSTTTTFSVEIDNEAPKVVRAYQDSSQLKIITDEKSLCSYSTNSEQKCNFQIEEGTNMPYVDSTEHSAEWVSGRVYYIKCKDSNDRQPFPNECSIIVRAQS